MDNSLRHFIAYHNAEKMGYSSSAMTEPKVKTSKRIMGLEGAMVWVIAGEGKRPKSYFLASRFIVKRCTYGKYIMSDLPNEISGDGQLFGKSVPLDGLPILGELRRVSANFRKGLFEVADISVIATLRTLK
ncbi:MAG: hypothetical protein EBR49_07160 [Betaproteobacteria bacterium]|nr:hypothetical protein [Betaproteobacteria bacterium]